MRGSMVARCWAAGLLGIVVAAGARAADWPTYRGDVRRSGVSEETLEFPLVPGWVHASPHPPTPAWPEMPAPRDYWHRLHALSPTHTYDRAFQPVVAGGRVYYGSSADDTVYCLDASGRVSWTWVAEGPVRLAPAVAEGRVYVGSDDGRVYCLDARQGTLLWQYAAVEPARWLPGNGRIISRWPVRCGLAVEGGRVYFTAGLFPLEGAWLCSLDARTGKELWKQPAHVSAQGYLLASSDRLVVPTGRTAPVAFARDTGKPLGDFGRIGGCFALVEDDMLVHGTSEDGQLHISEPGTREGIVSMQGTRLVAKGPMVYVLRHDALMALDRVEYLKLSKQIHAIEEIDEEKRTAAQNAQLALLQTARATCRKWEVACAAPYELILVGQALVAGGENEVVALSAADGKTLWRASVEGKAHGLAASDGRLLVSTDRGKIFCFQRAGKATSETVQPTTAATSATIPVTPAAQAAPSDLPKPAAASTDEATTALCQRAAEVIVKLSGVDQGYALVLGAGRGELAEHLARASRLQVVGIEPDPSRLDVARARLAAAGLQGLRVAMHSGTPDRLPYQPCTANLVVSQPALEGGALPPAEPIARVLRPCGGTIVLVQPADRGNRAALEKWGRASFPGWSVREVDGLLVGVAARGPLANTADWTHAYAEPGNTACSGDARIGGPVEIQWFGRPGPGRMIDRHHQNISALYKDGRLFVPGDQVIYALDAYNGTILWQLDLPGSRRLAMSHDCGSMAVDERLLYVALKDQCLGLDVRTGRRQLAHAMPQPEPERPRQWGYVAYCGPVLLGSGCKPGASFTEMSWAVDDSLWGRGQHTVTSDYVFGADRATGKSLWVYRSGIVPNTTLAAGDGRVYFVESQSPRAIADPTGRMKTEVLFHGGKAFLVALDQASGKVVFRVPIDVGRFEEIVYLDYARGRLVLSGSRAVGKTLEAHVFGFDAATGQSAWHASHDTELDAGGTHGEQNRHPAIVGTRVYAWPYAYDLATGRRDEAWKFDRHGHGCGEVSASAECLFWRGGYPWMYDLRPGGGPRQLTAVTRVGCWINVIPAGGLVMIPESSSGCTCPYPIQTSLALAPREEGG